MKNKQANTQKPSGKRTFTPKGLRHEINLLCQDVPKDKVLEQYMAVIQQEKAKLKKQKAKKSKVESSSEESSSDSDLEMNMIEAISNPKKLSLRKYLWKTMISLKRRLLTYQPSTKETLKALQRLDRDPWISIA